jgi:CheY-like chemotaxis protein
MMTMTDDMTFSALIISADTDVLSIMHRSLERLSINTRVCTSPERALASLSEFNTDLVIFEWTRSDEGPINFLKSLTSSAPGRGPISLAVASCPSAAFRAKAAGVHVVVERPITLESALRSLKAAYSLMVREKRTHRRHAIMKFVLASTDNSDLLPVMITDISESGIGILAKQRQRIQAGIRLRFDLQLPEMPRSIRVKVRVLWVASNNLAGARLERLAPEDLRLLYGWLERQRSESKKWRRPGWRRVENTVAQTH